MRTLKKACLLLLASLLLLTPLALLAGAGLIFSSGTLFGFRLFIVFSGSMQPAINVDDVLIVKACAPEDVLVGDIITFQTDSGGFVTHRVQQIRTELSGEPGLWFITKGDANNVVDALPVEAAQLVGKVIGRLPKLGNILEWRTPVILALLAIVLLLLLSWPMAALLIYLALRKPRSKPMLAATRS